MSAAPQRIDAAPTAEKPPLKAFTVLETCEDTGGIVLPGTRSRRGGRDPRSSGMATSTASPAGVPIGEMIEMGWHFECGGCGARIDRDYLAERDWRTEDVVGTQHSISYCNAVCEARHDLHRAEAAYHEARWIRRFRAFVRRRFPEAKLVPGEGIGGGARAYASKVDGRLTIQEIDVRFEFPGMDIAPASLAYRRRTPDRWRTPGRWPRQTFKHAKPEWSCCYGDKTAFEAFARGVQHDGVPA